MVIFGGNYLKYILNDFLISTLYEIMKEKRTVQYLKYILIDFWISDFLFLSFIFLFNFYFRWCLHNWSGCQGGKDWGSGKCGCDHCFKVFHFFFMSLRVQGRPGEKPHPVSQWFQHLGMGNGHQYRPRVQKYGTLHECACHPCAGAMLIISVSFQF